LPLEGLAFEHLGDAPPQKIDPGLNVFFEGIGLAAREGQQARAVGQLEIVDVAAVERFLGGRVKLLDHARDGAAAAGSCQAADKYVVARRGKFHAHFQGA
jgi:hypothetical protein